MGEKAGRRRRVSSAIGTVEVPLTNPSVCFVAGPAGRKCPSLFLVWFEVGVPENYPAKRPQTVCVRSITRKSRDLDALGSREVMVVIKLGIVVTVAVVVSE